MINFLFISLKENSVVRMTICIKLDFSILHKVRGECGSKVYGIKVRNL